jgi:hypothetical protein
MMDDGLNKSESAIEGNPLVRFAGIVVLAASLAVISAASADADEGASTTEADAVEGPSDDAESMVGHMIDEWLQEGAGRAIRAKEELNVVQGTSLVALKADNKRWGKARSLAYQNAFVQAMGAYIASVRQQTSVSVMRDYFAEDIPENELSYQEGEPPDSYVKRVVLKSAALVERTLDQKLTESGMSDDEIQRLSTPTQKRTELAERISRRTFNEAMGSAAGLIPVKTFEGVDDEGNSAIGVVAVYSERMRHIANQISRGDVIRPDPNRTRDSIADQVASYGKDELPNEFGVRVMWDEQGYPAIVSFGQWGWSPANLSKKKRAQRRKFAMKQAEADALSNLTVFIRASTRFTEESNVGADLEEAFNLPRGGVPEEIEETEIADKLVETARIKAEVTLTGFTHERSWSTRHPLLEEQDLVGVVAYWSPAREDAIRKTIGKEAKHAPPKEVSRKEPKKQVTGSAQSREPDLADF